MPEKTELTKKEAINKLYLEFLTIKKEKINKKISFYENKIQDLEQEKKELDKEVENIENY